MNKRSNHLELSATSNWDRSFLHRLLILSQTFIRPSVILPNRLKKFLTKRGKSVTLVPLALAPRHDSEKNKFSGSFGNHSIQSSVLPLQMENTFASRRPRVNHWDLTLTQLHVNRLPNFRTPPVIFTCRATHVSSVSSGSHVVVSKKR